MSRYDFFISYAHEDFERVRRLDRALRELLRRPFRRSGFQVFRDERRMAAGSDLTERLQAPMRDSRTLVVVLTPASARSPWVDREIAYWCAELGRTENMVLVRADPGVRLAWDHGAGTFVDAALLPPALVRAVDREPLYVDLGETAAADQEAAVRIAASTLGRAPEEIAGEDYRLQRRRRRLAVAAVSGLALLTVSSLVAGVLAIRSSDAAKRSERRAIADSFANRAIVEEQDRPDKALALALAAQRVDAESTGGEVLVRLLQRYDRRDRFARVAPPPVTVAVSDDGRLAFGDAEGGVRLGSGAVVPLGSWVIGLAFADADHLVAGLVDGRVVELTANEEGGLRKTAELAAIHRAHSWAVHRGTGMVAVGGSDPNAGEFGRDYLSLVRWRPGSLRLVTDAPGTAVTLSLPSYSGLAFDDAGRRLLVVHYRQAELLDVPSLQPVRATRGLVEASFIEGEAAAIRGDGSVVIAGNPSISADRTGILGVYAPDGSRHLGDATFELSVNALTRCPDGVYFGTRAGEYGRLPERGEHAIPLTEPFANVAGEVRRIACGADGPLTVVAGDGFVHVREIQDPLAGPALTLRAHEEEDAKLKTEEVVGMRIDGDAFVTAAGKRVRFTGADAERTGELLRGVPGGSFNCVAAAEPTLLRYDAEPAEKKQPLVVGRCGELELRVSGEYAETLTIRRGGRKVAEFPAGERVGTYALALSRDARRLFIGGYVNGALYDMTNPAAPRLITTVSGDEVITAASFASGGDVLITSETTPHGTFHHIRAHVLGGTPLTRLACRTGAGSLDGTVATEFLSAEERSRVGCR